MLWRGRLAKGILLRRARSAVGFVTKSGVNWDIIKKEMCSLGSETSIRGKQALIRRPHSEGCGCATFQDQNQKETAAHLDTERTKKLAYPAWTFIQRQREQI